jgi:thioredoxin reductase
MSKDENNVVCVVGAGFGGLCSAYNLMKRGIPVVILERTSALGGVWRADGPTYDGLICNTTKDEMVLPGLRFSEDTPTYPTRDHVRRQLETFAQQNGLLDAIRFNCRVTGIKQEHGDRWSVDIEGEATLQVSGVIVAMGQCHGPQHRHVPGLDLFEKAGGTVLHSSAFSKQLDVRDKHVLIVGFGTSSGGDIAQMVCRQTAKTTLTTRQGTLHIRSRKASVSSFLLSNLPEACSSVLLRLGLIQEHSFVRVLGNDPERTALDSYEDAFDFYFHVGEKYLSLKPALHEIRRDSSGLWVAEFVDKSTAVVQVVIQASGFARASIPLTLVDGTLLQTPSDFELVDHMFLENVPRIAFCAVLHPFGPHFWPIQAETKLFAELFTGDRSWESVFEGPRASIDPFQAKQGQLAHPRVLELYSRYFSHPPPSAWEYLLRPHFAWSYYFAMEESRIVRREDSSLVQNAGIVLAYIVTLLVCWWILAL